MFWSGLCMAVALGAAPPVTAAERVRLAPLGSSRSYTGFTLTVPMNGQWREAARVLLQAGERWKAHELHEYRQSSRRGFELRGIETSGTGNTPALTQGSYVRLSVAPGEVYPRLDFRLEVRSFDQHAWQAASQERAPLHFLALPLPTARVWYVHGLLCPTPRWDPYPLTRPGIKAAWAEGWSFGSALGALTVPATAIWDEQSGRMVGYEWAEPRFTDKSDKDLGIAYCAGRPGHEEQFLTLLSNWQKQWNELTYPPIPLTVQTSLRILYSLDLPATADVNQLVLQHIYRDYRPLLPRVPAMNDLSWMVERGLDELGAHGPSQGRFLSTVEGDQWGWNQMFFDPGTVLYWSDFRAVDQMYKQGKREAIERFDEDMVEFLKHVKRETINEDCCYWRYPLKGSWKEQMGGDPANTVHNVQQFGVGAAMLASYANTGRRDLLPYIDGLFNWARRCVFTRGDIADIPESMFTLQTTTLALEYLVNYWRMFAAAPDEERRRRAKQAFEMAHMVVYRNANVTLGDSDERDNLSGAFMMPGNMNKFWLGQISNAELCDPFRSMILMYVETGDPVFKWLVRGALERWWIGFKEDCWHTAENIDVWGESTGKKGTQTAVHGPCDSFWEWSQPVGDALMHVTCGARAALAFCRGTRALDVSEYSYAPPASFKFRVSGLSDAVVPQRFSMILSSPWRDLSGLRVRVGGKALSNQDVRVLGTCREHLYVPGVRIGDYVEIGRVGNVRPLPPPNVPTASSAADLPPQTLRISGRTFEIVDLKPHANRQLKHDWTEPENWGGLPVGLSYAYGVPYWVEPKAVGPGGGLLVRGREAYLLTSPARAAGLKVTTGGREIEFGPEDGLLAAEGWPLCKWELRLLPLKMETGGARVHVGEGGLLLGATVLQNGPGLADELLTQATQKKGTASKATTPQLLAEAKRRLETAGGVGRASAAFLPPHGQTYGTLAHTAEQLGIPAWPLTPQELVDERVFSATRFPLAVYTGDEQYYRTVKEPEDGERALARYLREGGTLVVAGACRPFTYAVDFRPDGSQQAQQKPWALFGKRLQLFLLGPGEVAADAAGFELPPREVALEMRLAPKQPVLWDFPRAVAFPQQGDRRYRPMTREGVPAEDEVVPILTTVASDGREYGPAAALITHKCPQFRGGQVLWIWGTLLLPPFDLRDEVATQGLTFGVAAAHPAREPLPQSLAMIVPPGEFRVAVLPPDCWERERIIAAACHAAGAAPVFLSPDQFVNGIFFNAANFPVAIQAVSSERFILTYRRPRDGEQAYKRYLEQGGTLIVCQPATPFWYEMTWQGGHWRSHPPERFWSMTFDLGFETEYGFEKPEEALWLVLTEEGRWVWPELPQRLELNYLRDQRWRSLVPYRSSAARRFVTLAHLSKPNGTPYRGLAAGMVGFLESEYPGARLLYLWGNMVDGPIGEKMLTGCLKYVKAHPPNQTEVQKRRSQP